MLWKIKPPRRRDAEQEQERRGNQAGASGCCVQRLLGHHWRGRILVSPRLLSIAQSPRDLPTINRRHADHGRILKTYSVVPSMMSNTAHPPIEKQVKIAAKLYAARDAMRGFWRESYKAKMQENQGFIRAGMAKYKCDELAAKMKMVGVLQMKYPDSGMTQALLLAACVEMIEPSI
jgi:hypothetical protein